MVKSIMKFPMFITWSITSNCNLRCKHCFRNEYSTDILTESIVDDIVKYFIDKKIVSLILTGGEPLLSPHLERIIIKSKGKFKIGIATNAIDLNDNLIEKYKKLGVSNYQISLEGTTEDINDYIRGVGTYKKIIKSILLLKKHKCNVTLAMTANRYNYIDIQENSISLAKKMGVDSLRIESYIPLGNGSDWETQFILPDDKITLLIDKLSSKKAYGLNIQVPRFDHQYGCGAGVYNCVLNADLSLSPCDLLTDYLKTKPITKVEDIEEYWNTDFVFNEWRKNLICNQQETIVKNCSAFLYKNIFD